MTTADDDRVILGMLTPSSNTVLEPLTAAMLDGLPEVSAHFARLRVTEITLSAQGLAQFDPAPFLAAAGLLADARCDVIAWNGTSGGWRGFADDADLVRRIEAATGARATTSILALNDLLRRHGVTRLGLVTPYTDDVQARIVANYAAAGIDCVAERHLGISDNFAFSRVPEDTVAAMCREVAAAGPQAIAVICTNLRAARLAPALEAGTGIPVYDSVAVVVLRALELAGVEPARVAGWGRIFAQPRVG